VFAVIFVGVVVAAVEIFEESIVDGGLADHVFLARPIAEVEEFAAVAAERKFRDGLGIRGFLADGAVEFHAIKNTAKSEGMYLSCFRDLNMDDRPSLRGAPAWEWQHEPRRRATPGPDDAQT
jgi:hypothetical protein